MRPMINVTGDDEDLESHAGDPETTVETRTSEELEEPIGGRMSILGKVWCGSG